MHAAQGTILLDKQFKQRTRAANVTNQRVRFAGAGHAHARSNTAGSAASATSNAAGFEIKYPCA